MIGVKQFSRVTFDEHGHVLIMSWKGLYQIHSSMALFPKRLKGLIDAMSVSEVAYILQLIRTQYLARKEITQVAIRCVRSERCNRCHVNPKVKHNTSLSHFSELVNLDKID